MVDQAAPLSQESKGLRGQILLELKKAQPLTAKELARRFDVTPNAIRRHLKELEADRLIAYGRQKASRGAPTFAYRLTDLGEARFPRRYAEQLTEVLSYLEARGGREEVRRFFDEHFKSQAAALLATLGGASLEDRVRAVVHLLKEQGFMAEWSVEGDTVRIAEHNCAVQAVAERFPELCEAEANFLRDILQTDVKRAAYIPKGCNACEYAVTLGGVPRGPHPENI
jgi:DeoR family suf operon transcriptional repressor